MQIKYYPYTLELNYTFSISTYSRNSTPAVLIELTDNGITGYGEISMPQYLGETVDGASAFLNRLDLSKFNSGTGISEILEYVDSIDIRNNAAKAGVDIALHDLIGKKKGIPVRELYGIKGNQSPQISFTIGIDKEEILIKKLADAARFEYLKIKLGTDGDRKIVELIRKNSDKKIIVDINQGWKEKEYALEMIYFLKENNVVLVEQPLSKNNLKDQIWLKERSPLPVFADESIQRLNELDSIKECFHGINIKLMKCTGIREAYRMIKKGKEYGLKIMLGCMTETSCAISAAVQLSPLADYADLDGNLLIKNDPFTGLQYSKGRIVMNDLPGLGVKKIT